MRMSERLTLVGEEKGSRDGPEKFVKKKKVTRRDMT